MSNAWAYIREGSQSESATAPFDPTNHVGEVTLMLRNLSRKLNQEAVKRVLDERGLRGKFSYIYVPEIIVRRSSTGYAFVRFRSIQYAQECFRFCHGKPFGTTSKTKSCRVCYANIQDDVRDVLQMPRRKHHGQEPDILLCDDPIDPPDVSSAAPVLSFGATAPGQSWAGSTGWPHAPGVYLSPQGFEVFPGGGGDVGAGRGVPASSLAAAGSAASTGSAAHLPRSVAASPPSDPVGSLRQAMSRFGMPPGC